MNKTFSDELELFAKQTDEVGVHIRIDRALKRRMLLAAVEQNKPLKQLVSELFENYLSTRYNKD